MPQRKTKKSAAKRFRLLPSGKIKRKRGNLRHLLTGKGKKRKRNLRKRGYISAANAPEVRRMFAT